MENKLKLMALDAEDLSVISSAVQDALVAVRDCAYFEDEKRFVLLVNRFRWEADPEVAPAALMHNLKHNRVLHQRVIFLTVVTQDVPVVPPEDRVQVAPIGDGFYRIEAWYGFKEEPNLADVLNSCKPSYKLDFDMMDTSFFLSRETVIPSELPGMPAWRDHLFAWMSRNAMRATDYYQIPANRVVELGTHVEI